MTTFDSDILRVACNQAGFDHNAAELVSRHATSVYLLRGHVIARIHRSGPGRARAMSAVRVAQWLTDQGFPATEPCADPLDVDGQVVTFWRYYPQPAGAAPGAGSLGTLLRWLHALPQPPVDLPTYEPLTHLGQALRESRTALSGSDHAWLSDRRHELIQAYYGLHSPLGIGWVHGDAYPGNTVWDGDLVRLGDWDEVSVAPRELDLVNTHQGVRFGRYAAERDAFTAAYGWDVTTWTGYPTLREMRDLHTLAAFIDRAAGGDNAAGAELQHRIRTLRVGDTTARWNTA